MNREQSVKRKLREIRNLVEFENVIFFFFCKTGKYLFRGTRNNNNKKKENEKWKIANTATQNFDHSTFGRKFKPFTICIPLQGASSWWWLWSSLLDQHLNVFRLLVLHPYFCGGSQDSQIVFSKCLLNEWDSHCIYSVAWLWFSLSRLFLLLCSLNHGKAYFSLVPCAVVTYACLDNSIL